MTLMTGDWKPVHSNNLLKKLFGHKGLYEDTYEKGGDLWVNKPFIWDC